MPASSSALLAVLAVALCAAFVAYVPVRRPRERSSWALAGVALGLLIYYLCDFFLHRPGLALSAAFFWQKLSLQGAGIASSVAVVLALSLRNSPIPRWERMLALALIARAVADMAFMAAMTPQPRPGCNLPSGVPMLHCGFAKDLGTYLALLSAAATGWLFYRTFRLASDARRRVFMRYILPAALLIFLVNIINLAWGLRPGGMILPAIVLIIPAAVLVAQGLLRLEEVDRGLHLSVLTQALIVWMFLLIVSVVLDAWWLRGQTPILSMLTLVTGLTAALAFLARRVAVLERQTLATGQLEANPPPNPEAAFMRATAATDPPASTPAVLPENAAAAPRLEIRLLGPFRLERAGASPPTESWRSDKSRSLLAYLILAHGAGRTRAQLVDALWPIGDDGDGDAEKKALNALRSYVSTLRRVLDPGRSRDAPSMIIHDGDRYHFAPPADVWVDVWEFERLAATAEQHAREGRGPEAADAWEQAVALHGELGLLPDEVHLPAEAVEPERERLRQQWLRGVRWLARHDAQHGAIERSVTLWEMAHRATPLHAEAYHWLSAHYRQTGQTAQLAALQDARRAAAREVGDEEAT